MPGTAVDLIELGVGFNPDMAARDNVVMNGIMLGLSPREARKRYESVIEFAELEEFKDLKLKNYSSGMHVRLAFSVAIQVDADILMIDEVLAVGDAAFQQKCFDVFNELRDRGRTIIFVTHDMGALQRFCHRALLLERGRPGVPGRATRGRRPLPGAQLRPRSSRHGSRRGRTRGGDGEARDRRGVAGERGRRATVGRSPAPAGDAQCAGAFMVDVDDPSASVYVYNEEHRAVVVATTGDGERAQRPLRGRRGGRVLVHVRQRPRRPGRYSPVFQLAHRGSGLDVIDRFEGSFSFVVTGPGALGGLVDLPVHSAVSRVSSARRTDARMSVQAPPTEATSSAQLRHTRSLGRPIRGPRALTGDWRRFWHLTFNIAVMQWKLRFFGSALGYLWQLVRPLLLFLVLYVFFTKVARRRGRARARATTSTAPSCSASIVLFTFFSEATSRRGAQRGRQRDPGSQDPVPAHGDPALGRAAGVFQPLPESGRGDDLRADRRASGRC